MDEIKNYRPNKTLLWGVLFLFCIVFFGLTLPRLIEGTFESNHIKGLAIFYSFMFIIGAIPFIARLEVGKDYVKTFFLGFCTADIRSSKVIVVEYGNLMRFGGLGFGKGLRIATETDSGRRKYYSIGENNFGKEAVKHARRVLENK